jgi:hypothetical protein
MSEDGLVTFWLVDQYLFSPPASVQPSSPDLDGLTMLLNQGFLTRLSWGSGSTGNAYTGMVQRIAIATKRRKKQILRDMAFLIQSTQHDFVFNLFD